MIMVALTLDEDSQGKENTMLSRNVRHFDPLETFLSSRFGLDCIVRESPMRYYRIEHGDAEMRVCVELPGVKPDDLNVLAAGSRIDVEFSLRGAKRSFHVDVDDSYDAAACSGTLEHGVLELRLPKRQRADARKIDIKVR